MPPNRPPFFNPQRRPNPEKQTCRRGSDPSCPSHRSATKTRASLIYGRPMYFSHALIRLARQTPIAEIQEELFDLADRLERMDETDPAIGSKRQGADGSGEILPLYPLPAHTEFETCGNPAIGTAHARLFPLCSPSGTATPQQPRVFSGFELGSRNTIRHGSRNAPGPTTPLAVDRAGWARFDRNIPGTQG